MNWSHLKEISETLKNFVEALALFGAGFAWWQWIRQRHDRSTDVLFGLEKEFANPTLVAARDWVADEEQYRSLAPVLARYVIGTLSPGRDRECSPEELKALGDLDQLLRFYVFLHSICNARQAPESALRASYRYWLTFYFHPGRTAFRAYVDWFYPTVSKWLHHDERRAQRWWWRRQRFFDPVEFDWVGTEQQKREQVRRGIQGRVLVLTGAGISADSGIPTFRGKGGYWRKLNPRALATSEAFHKNPGQVWEWYHERRGVVRQSEPNPAHRALTQLALNCRDFLLVTQNVDDLHERAEFEGHRLKESQIVHIHGRLFVSRCLNCRTEVDQRNDPLTTGIPECPVCGGPMRPAVVWFDEENDPPEEQRVEDFLERGPCDLVLVVGATATFDYIRRWALEGALNGGWLVEVNPHETWLSKFAHFILRARARKALPGLVGSAVDAGPLWLG